MKVGQEEGESRSSAVILVDVLRSGLILILTGEEWKGHYAGLEESRSSVGWRDGQWGMGGRESFPGGWQSRAVAG
jgi:hypothetical protein